MYDEECKRTSIGGGWVKSFAGFYALLYIRANPDSSGYDICKHVKEKYGCNLSYSRVYPLLNTLNNEGFISMKKEESSYPPKKVYKLTEEGHQRIKRFRDSLFMMLDEFME
ncbi:MAG: hypothetical protein B6U97_01880 [Candidatus Altiarchaeales archaeon ex4484_96]|nr:MAG: hypothetical protein B6U97_01880 [Candidatus Altiarchaeales archaeon ex4484_96]